MKENRWIKDYGLTLAAGIVVDLSYGFIDPRIRMGSKK